MQQNNSRCNHILQWPTTNHVKFKGFTIRCAARGEAKTCSESWKKVNIPSPRKAKKKKLLYWSNPPDPNFTPYPRHFYLFIYFFLRRKNKNKSIIMDIKVGKPQNMQLYVRRKVKMFRSPILLCGYGLCVQV